MMEPTKSRINLHDFPGKKESNSDLVDRISVLPDSILGVILSFLPTKEAVVTVVLSKRWIFVWRTAHNLDFCQGVCHEDEDVKFIEFVNRVLHLHDNGLLNKFSLDWNPRRIPSSHSNSWINTAITKNVHKLSLCGVGSYDLPMSVFSCDSLQSLKLTGSVTSISDALVICLPRLESLKLDRVCFESEEACEKLISGFPMLKYLHLHISNDDFKCIISSASLRRLTIFLQCKSSLKLKAFSLEHLRLDGYIYEIFVEKGLGSLVEVDFKLMLDEDLSYNSIVETIRACHCAKVLSFSRDAMRTLCATIKLSTEFKRLVKLVAVAYRPLQDFIRNSDNLQVLIIYQDLHESDDEHLKWNTLVEVPRCLSNSLKKVQLYYYTINEDEFELIRFMLEHGSALEVMEISYDGDIDDGDFDLLQERFELLQTICEFPRKSPACKVRFSYW